MEIDLNKLRRVIRSDGSLIAEAKLALDPDEKLKPILTDMREKKFSAKDTGISHRVLNNWSENGLIKDDKTERGSGWRKLSVVDLIWISFITEVRKFGMPLSKLKTTFKSVFEYMTSDATIEFWTLRCAQRDQIVAIVFEDGWCEFMHKAEFNNNLSFGFLSSTPFLFVDFNACVKRVLPKLGPPIMLPTIELSDSESEAISYIREGKYDELHIKLEDGSIKSLNKIENSKEFSEELLEQIKFGEVTITIQDGKTVFVKTKSHERTKP